MTEVRLDRVFTFGDQLSFLIPHEWIEDEEKGDHYIYHAPNADSGWLRVSLLTLKSPGRASKERVREFLAKRARKRQADLYEVGDNVIVAWVESSEEEGTPIYNYWWAVGPNVDPNLSHEALFSYTILRERRDDVTTQETLDLLAELVAGARFAPPNMTM